MTAIASPRPAELPTSMSLPASRTSTPPPPPSRAIPMDFKSSLSAWWSNSSYREARYAEERLLRRMAMYQPPPQHPNAKGHLGMSSPTASTSDPGLHTSVAVSPDSETREEVVPPTAVGDSGLVATLRNVFIPTPDGKDAPSHPAEPRLVTASAEASPAGSTTSVNKTKHKHHFPHPHHHKKSSDKLVDYINTLEISRPEDKNAKEAVVVLHGYAAALGFFFRNWEPIAQAGAATHRRTFFLDWLGMGLSSRPSPHIMSSPSSASVPARVARAEHFFISSLEDWRKAMGLEKLVLVGHSLGGYLASAYTVRYPENVSSLILVSPAGIPRGPEWRHYPVEGRPDDLGMIEAAGHGVPPESESPEAPTAAQPKGEAQQWNQNQTLFTKAMRKFFVWGWDKGLSPFTIVRSVGPWAPMFVGRYSSRRFANQTEEDVRDLHAYIYNTTILKGSGEFCISHILAPGAHARVPIIDRINKVKCPVTFIYGDNDWMDVEGGHDSVKVLKQAGNQQAECHVVPKAGHHVYLDNPDKTNEIIGAAIKAAAKSIALQSQ